MWTRRALAVVALAAAVAVLLATVELSGKEPRVDAPGVQTLPLRPLQVPGARIMRDSAHALRVAVPPGWRRSRQRVTPRLAPTESSILVLTTFPVRVLGRHACTDSPGMPQVRIGAREALIHVQELLDAQPGTKPRRPQVLRLRKQLRGPRRCASRPGIVGLRSWFRAHGRLIQVTAVAGERTSTRRRRELLGILESLRFGPPAPVAVSVHPPSGNSATRFRVALVSTHRSGRRGRRVRNYWAEVEGSGGIACVVETEAWFSSGPPGARLHAELDPTRTKGGRWCPGPVDGVVRYRDGFCGRPGRCWGVHTRVAGRFRFVVRPP
jgi:hypothetical protein